MIIDYQFCPYTKEDKLRLCREFMRDVALLKFDTYDLIGSCNKDTSLYLIPHGTIDQLTYYSKPNLSLRFSDHWNWYSSTKKCDDERLVQCRSLDIPWARRREEPGKATKPRYGIQVAIYDAKDECYHHVYGDKFDRKTKTWHWCEIPIWEVLDKLIG